MDQRGLDRQRVNPMFAPEAVAAKEAKRQRANIPRAQSARQLKGQLLNRRKMPLCWKVTRPTSGLQGSQVAAALPKVPVDAESLASLCALKSSVHHNTSRVPSGAASPSCAELLPGFVAIDSWDAVQANTYVVLGHGPYQRRVLTCGMLSVTVALFHYLAYRLIGRQVDHWCMAPDLLVLSVGSRLEKPFRTFRG
ncbi:hypothetical protein MTO96_025521 [Rhipicephalus appendiculatus]